MLHRLQYWFDRLMDVASQEDARRLQSHRLFAAPRAEINLDRPACWRRTPRVRQLRREQGLPRGRRTP